MEKLEKYQKAIEHYKKAIKIDREHSVSWKHMCSSLFKLKKYKEAQQSCDKYIKLDAKNSYESWYYKGLIKENLSFDFFKKSYAAIKSDLGNQNTENNPLVNVLAAITVAQLEDAIEAYDKAIEMNHNYYEAWSKRALALSFIYMLTQDLGKADKALKSINKAIEINDNFSENWHLKSSLETKLGMNRKALHSIGRAIQINPKNELYWLSKGTVLYVLKRYNEAITSFEKAIKINSGSSKAWYLRGLALESLGHHKSALKSIDKSLQIEPDPFIQSHRNLIESNSAYLSKSLQELTKYGL